MTNNPSRKDDAVMKSPLALAAALTVLAPAAVHAQPITPPLHGEPLPPPDPAALDYARQIVEALLPPERREGITLGMTGTIINQMGQAAMGHSTDAGLREVVSTFLTRLPGQIKPVGDRHVPLIMDAMTRVVAREYSLEELKQISSFAQTPAGGHYLSRSLALLAEPSVTSANQAFFAEAVEVGQSYMPQFRAAVTEYLIKHPDVARQVNGPAQSQARPTP
jgi:hypothetical protein